MKYRIMTTLALLLIIFQGWFNAIILRNIDSKIDKIVIFLNLDLNAKDKIME